MKIVLLKCLPTQKDGQNNILAVSSGAKGKELVTFILFKKRTTTNRYLYF